MATSDQLIDVLADLFADPETGFSLGTFGAIAEVTRDAGEQASFHRSGDSIGIVTGRGGLRIHHHGELRLIASEQPTRLDWSHRLALCLPLAACAMNRRAELTEIGVDADALRREDRDAVLFDLGLATLQVDVCIRSADPQIIAALRGCVGKSVFAAGNDAMRIILSANPHRVFVSRIGRAEVFQPIPPPGGQSPTGPHTHVLPKLLAHGRTHAATEPLPDGWIPCAHVYPPHPLRDQFGRKRPFQRSYHDAFELLFRRYGVRELVTLKRQVVDAVIADQRPRAVALAESRFARATIRVALRQLQALQPSLPALAAWLADDQRMSPADIEDPMQSLH